MALECVAPGPRRRPMPSREAHLVEEPLVGPALDFPKCYDRLPFAVLWLVAARAGVPAAVVGPMLPCYGGPRRVRADGLAGPAEESTRGLAPGCPAAPQWLALVALCWRAGATAAG